MAYKSKIIGVGSYVPPKVVTNQDLEEMLNTSDEWIQQRTGIKERRWIETNVSNSDLAAEASKVAIADAGITKDDIDLIVFATITEDYEFPGNGCLVQEKLDIPSGVPALDIRQACSGFIYGLSIVNNFIKSGQYKNILLIGSEVHSKGLDLSPEGRDVSVLFGDGAGAIIVTRSEEEGADILGTHLHADGRYAKNLWTPGPGTAYFGEYGHERITSKMIEDRLHYPIMQGKTVFTHAVKKMSETLTTICKENNVALSDIDCFLFHQANIRINDKVGEMLGLDPSKVFNTIQKFGNTTAATIPIGMDCAIKEGMLKPGMLVGMAAFGSGFTWGSALLRL